ncbi:MAG: hypothetical protein K2Z81_04785, partial [Cyanobacteria bacterium]|nr:hypothetical protein [Cyanobacteriota bacterium]
RLISNYDKQELQCKMRIFSILTVVLLVVASISPGFLGINLKTGFDPTRVPTTTLDYIRDHKLPFDRGFNFDNWGGYIRWKLDQRVFIDDRADFYGEPFYLEYAKVLQAAPDWNEVLDKYKVEWILMPKESPSMVPWKGRQGWRIASEDPAALLLVREKPLATPPAVAPTTTP